MKDAFCKARAAATPEIPPPITITEGQGLCLLSILEGKLPEDEYWQIRVCRKDIGFFLSEGNKNIAIKHKNGKPKGLDVSIG